MICCWPYILSQMILPRLILIHDNDPLLGRMNDRNLQYQSITRKYDIYILLDENDWYMLLINCLMYCYLIPSFPFQIYFHLMIPPFILQHSLFLIPVFFIPHSSFMINDEWWMMNEWWNEEWRKEWMKFLSILSFAFQPSSLSILISFIIIIIN